MLTMLTSLLIQPRDTTLLVCLATLELQVTTMERLYAALALSHNKCMTIYTSNVIGFFCQVTL